jgi:hypothetical protein
LAVVVPAAQAAVIPQLEEETAILDHLYQLVAVAAQTGTEEHLLKLAAAVAAESSQKVLAAPGILQQ